ncbi:hypothetical protein [Aquirufa nivalisilvae]
MKYELSVKQAKSSWGMSQYGSKIDALEGLIEEHMVYNLVVRLPLGDTKLENHFYESN